MLFASAVKGDGCEEDFSPCTCTPFPIEDSVINVECDQVSSDEIVEAFSRNTTTNLIRLFLKLSDNSSHLPADLLGENRAEEIDLTCMNRDFDLTVDRDAFRNSASSLLSLFIFDCPLSATEFVFLTGFQVINYFQILNSTFPSLGDLPKLPSLYELIISECSDFTEWGKPDLTSLVEFRLGYNLLGDQTVDEILDSILAMSSDPSLQTLILQNNNLTRIPESVHLFPNLTDLNMDGNTIPIIKAGSITFGTADFVYLRLEDLSMAAIEPGAFQGFETE